MYIQAWSVALLLSFQQWLSLQTVESTVAVKFNWRFTIVGMAAIQTSIVEVIKLFNQIYFIQ